jgi:hypothetical protein
MVSHGFPMVFPWFSHEFHCHPVLTAGQVRDKRRASWRDSRLPLLEIQIAPELTGFEDEVRKSWELGPRGKAMGKTMGKCCQNRFFMEKPM